MAKVDKILSDKDVQFEFKELLQLKHIDKKLDAYTAIKFLLKDIYYKNKKSDIAKLGWNRPEDIPFYPKESSFRTATSGTFYNPKLIVAGRKTVEYDFIRAYTQLMEKISLPYQTILNVKNTNDKVLNRLNSYTGKATPYSDLKTFMFFQVDMIGIKKPNTYISYGNFSYGEELNIKKTWLTEIEVKLIMDFYEVEYFNVRDSYTFKCKKGLLNDYFDRIEPLRYNPKFEKIYKAMRTTIFGIIGQKKLRKGEENSANVPFYNRAYASMVVGVFRDRIIRYEQKYVHSEYGLWQIKLDGLYFMQEVPLFEKLLANGFVTKKIHTITEDEEKVARRMIKTGVL